MRSNVLNKPQAVFVLGSGNNNCTEAALEGTYMSGTGMTHSNTVKIQVNVTKEGSYQLTTDKVNGVSFFASGSFIRTGTQKIVLAATGIPQAEGKRTFSITGTNSQCNFDVDFLPKARPAAFTFAGAPNACAMPVIKGMYVKGKVLTNSNNVRLKVRVTATGSYNISTEQVNGISFSGSGQFSTTGDDMFVVLKGTGTPLKEGNAVFKPNVNSACAFTVNIQNENPNVTHTASSKKAL